MIFDTFFDEQDKTIKFVINGKIYKKKEIDLKEIGFDNYINNVKLKYISYYNNIDDINNNYIYKLKKILFDAKILYSLYINYIKFDEKNSKKFDKELDEIIYLDEYKIIKEELFIIKFFFAYTYINHFYKLKN